MRKRFTIGFQTVNLHSKYSFSLWNAIAKEAELMDADLILFPGESPHTPYGYAYQSNTIYDFINPHNMDALIIAAGTLSPFMTKTEFEKYYKRFMPLPMVSIGINLRECPSILVDNSSGMKSAVRHLIECHDMKRVAIIRGPESNAEAQLRFHAYLEALEENGISPDPDLFLSGDFQEVAGVNAVNELFQVNKIKCEAIIASNDDMALGALKELKRLKIAVPESVALCGFDNVEAAQFSIPSLTTVAQPLVEQGKLALETAIALLEGRPVEKTYFLPTELIVRTSCGCVSGMNRILEHDSQLYELAGSIGGEGAASLKEKMLAECICTLEQSEYSADYARYCVAEMDRLIGSFENDTAEEGNNDSYYKKLSSFFQTLSQEKYDLKIWPQILTLMENDFHRHEYDQIRAKALDSRFRQSFNMLNEMIRTEFATKKIDLENCNLKLRDIQIRISSTRSPEELSEILLQELPQFNIQGCLVFRYIDRVVHSRSSRWENPSVKELVSGFLKDRIISREVTDSKKLIPDFIKMPDKQMIWCAFSIFMMEEQLGYVLINIGERDGYLYESLGVLISGFIHSCNVINARDISEAKLRKALAELESYSLKMSNISRTDELTGLFNRRGFLILGEQSLSMALQMKKNGLLFYIDLDGLKQINDQYGHDEGDVAIKYTAQILRSVFRGMDILARLGGDEFTVLTINTDPEFNDTIEKRIDEKLFEINSNSGKPYKLGMSIGWANYSYQEPQLLENLITKADHMLCDKKRIKKAIR